MHFHPLTARKLIAVSLCVIAFSCPLFLWIGMRLVHPDLPGVTGPHLSYAEFVSALLTAVTVILAALGIMIAMAAIWGYQGIQEKGTAVATEAAKREVRDYLSGDEGRHLLEELIRPEVDNVIQSSALAQAYPTNGGTQTTDGTEKLAEEYHIVEEAKSDCHDDSERRD